MGGASAKEGLEGREGGALSLHRARSAERGARIHHSQRVPVSQSGDWSLTSLRGGPKHVRFREEVKISFTFMGQIKLDCLNSYTMFSCGSRLLPWRLERAKHTCPGEGTHVAPTSSHSGNLLPNRGVLKYIIVTVT